MFNELLHKARLVKAENAAGITCSLQTCSGIYSQFCGINVPIFLFYFLFFFHCSYNKKMRQAHQKTKGHGEKAFQAL